MYCGVLNSYPLPQVILSHQSLGTLNHIFVDPLVPIRAQKQDKILHTQLHFSFQYFRWLNSCCSSLNLCLDLPSILVYRSYSSHMTQNQSSGDSLAPIRVQKEPRNNQEYFLLSCIFPNTVADSGNHVAAP